MVVFRFVKSCVHALFLCGVCPINLTVDRRICGRAGFSYLYSFHCFHLAPLVSRHVGQVAPESPERYQNPPAASTPASKAPQAPCRGGHVRFEPPSAERACARHFFAFTCGRQMPVVACGALRGRLLKAFCRCPGDLRAARRLRLFCFSKFLSIAKWFDVVSFSATLEGLPRPLLSLYTPVDGRSIWQTLSASIFNDIA